MWMNDQSLPMERIDITSKVYGKFDQNSMNLFLNKEQIGRILFTNEGNRYEFSDGFEFDQDRIFRYERAMEKNGRYVEDCDLGWC